jgi:stage II sporulation protein AA (anti-sigma F factor antagonist)
MGVKTERQGNTLIAKTDGRVDGTNAREFQADLEAAIDESERAVILDMEELSYISSAGLRVILLTAKNLRNQDAKFAVCSLSGPIQEVFEISGFDKIISIHASQAEALASFKD